MKTKILLLVMSLSVLMLAGGCSKKEGTVENDTTGNTQNVDDTEDKADENETDNEVSSEIITVTKEAYEVSDYISLGEYKGIEYTIKKLEVTEADVEETVEEILKRGATEQEVADRDQVQNGDIVNIDFEGLKDGVAFDGGTAQDYDLIIGSGSFIPGFEEGLIGTTVGEQVDVNLSFPEDYHQPDLAGQPVVFKVTVNSIKELVYPELTEEYVKEISEFDTIDAFKEDIRVSLQEMNEATMESEKFDNVFNKVLDNSEVKSYPQNLLDYYSAVVKNRIIQNAAYFGMDFATFLSSTGLSEEDFDAEMLKSAEIMAKQELVLNAIVKAENLELSDEEYEEGVENISKDFGYSSKEEFLANAVEDEIRETLLWQKAVDLILNAAVEL